LVSYLPAISSSGDKEAYMSAISGNRPPCRASSSTLSKNSSANAKLDLSAHSSQP
jgi:hypothetical protein